MARTRSLLAAALCAAAVAALAAGQALAGEVTPGGRSQSFGQDIKLGLANPHEFNPGVACNPNKTSLPPQPNRG
jgi:hypothetical protein